MLHLQRSKAGRGMERSYCLWARGTYSGSFHCPVCRKGGPGDRVEGNLLTLFFSEPDQDKTPTDIGSLQEALNAAEVVDEEDFAQAVRRVAEGAVHKLLDEKIQSMDKSLGKVLEDLQSMTISREIAVKEKASAEKECASLERRKDRLQERKEELKEELEESKSQVKTARRELKAKVEELKERNKSALQALKEEHAMALKKKDSKIEELRERLESKRTDLKIRKEASIVLTLEQEKTIKSLKKEVRNLKSKAEETTDSEQENEIKYLKKKVRELKKKVEDTKCSETPQTARIVRAVRSKTK
ncbi:hypothetical protein T439DRAFT_48625 [Meredithblackwellia eburnea MCA 4105]